MLKGNQTRSYHKEKKAHERENYCHRPRNEIEVGIMPIEQVPYREHAVEAPVQALIPNK